MTRVRELSPRPLMMHAPPEHSRLVAGLMSGTSIDGIDAIVAKLSGSGRAMQIDQKAFVCVPFPPALRDLLMELAHAERCSVTLLSQANVRLAHAYAHTVRVAADAAGLAPGALDLVGSHGQTVCHAPLSTPCAGVTIRSTLQIGDPSVLANVLGTPVVGDFRLADMALGGQGAPLVPYFDYIRFADDTETRGLLNLGGIANLTVLPAGAGMEAVHAFDTGPGNMVLDGLAMRLFGSPFDACGNIARAGSPNADLLGRMLKDPYFAAGPPKSTGRRYFGKDYANRLLAWGEHLPAEDLMATAAMLTVRSVHQAYTQFLAEDHPLDAMLLSGGGRHNAFLVQQLRRAFDPVPVRMLHAYGVDPDAKEALCFAVLAHETMNGVPTNLPSVTGASQPTLLGKICLPLLTTTHGSNRHTSG